MDAPLLFCLAVLTLLAVPGPTNTLLAASGATVGFYRSLPLLLGELAGYNIAIVTLRETIGVLFNESRSVEVLLKLAVASYLVFLSIRLWRAESTQRTASFTVRRVFLTTLLNPKAIIFGLLIIPLRPPSTALYLAAFSVMAVAVGTVWIAAGNLVKQLAGARSTLWAPRLASLALAAFATLVIVSIQHA
jgi:threonine/homoserine/homoserine lactone efflux protein